MAIYLTSDLHFGHIVAANHRGFDSVEEHDEALINNWNAVVQPRDEVYVLGDIMFGDKERGVSNTLRLRGYLHLVLGNHDRPAPNNKNGHKHYNAMGDAWNTISQLATISYAGTSYLMSHYPYEGDHTEETRYDQYRPRDLGMPLFHGHIHSDSKFSVTKHGTPQYHVGLDAWDMKPVLIRDALSV